MIVRPREFVRLTLFPRVMFRFGFDGALIECIKSIRKFSRALFRGERLWDTSLPTLQPCRYSCVAIGSLH
jgi:hypothetical protein